MNADLLTWVLLAEVLLVAVGILCLLIFVASRQKKTTHKAIQTLTKKIKKNISARKEKVDEDGSFSSFNDKLIDELFDEVQQKESKMYQHIARIFLKKEADDLKSLDVYMNEISEPYLKALKEVIDQSQIKTQGGTDLSMLNSELALVVNENERLSEQLTLALKTLDEVSNEYANMFDGKKEREELNSSRARVLDHFYQVLQKGNREPS
ncbi:MAG: hypothetical protein QNK15_12410 [Cycloclasticus sp.]|nr:hypothetical protein [Cycloclasticus sp.]